MRAVVEDKKISRSLISSVSKMWPKYEWEDGQIRETKKYRIKYRFDDKGPHFLVTDKNSGLEYYVSAFIDSWIYGPDVRFWGAYHKEKVAE